MLTSCSKWLDVRPESEVDMETLLQTETGFQAALNGVYTNCQTQLQFTETTMRFPDYHGRELFAEHSERMSTMSTNLSLL